MNAFAAVGIWFKERGREKKGKKWLASWKTKISNSHPTDFLHTSRKSQKKPQEKVYARTSDDTSLSENLRKCSLIDDKQSLDTSNENPDFGAPCSISTLSDSITSVDKGLMGVGIGEDEKGRPFVEMIRKEKLLEEFEKIWKTINEIKGSTKETSDDSSAISPCDLGKVSKIPIREVIKK